MKYFENMLHEVSSEEEWNNTLGLSQWSLVLLEFHELQDVLHTHVVGYPNSDTAPTWYYFSSLKMNLLLYASNA